MSKKQFLWSALLSIMVYVVISVVFGASGIWSYNQLENQKIKIAVNIDQLEKLNQSIEMDYKGLKYDSEVIQSYAHQLGFVSQNEKLVKLSGVPERVGSPYDPGTKVYRTEIKFVPEWVAKLAAIFIFVFINVIYSLIIVAQYSKERRKKVILQASNVVEGIFDDSSKIPHC
jgi:cell division protein FtsB